VIRDSAHRRGRAFALAILMDRFRAMRMGISSPYKSISPPTRPLACVQTFALRSPPERAAATVGCWPNASCVMARTVNLVGLFWVLWTPAGNTG
jgi:hypothetical protein